MAEMTRGIWKGVVADSTLAKEAISEWANVRMSKYAEGVEDLRVGKAAKMGIFRKK